ncbi:TonB-dependent receptor [Niastella populi]|uniref:TonB-dependent receptor n=1 Tax=Niastella populi TaxID=550983 RepID=A0A1V9FN51_9BACT|nr:TonB-dependent receptor [Niastella populi]OQP59794.1 TonB-dependent receptor [Niastella populi]
MKLFIHCVTALLIVLTGVRSYAQTNCTGKVIDAITKEPVAHASIQIKNTNQGTITNNRGEFTLPLTDTGNELTISSLGYFPATVANAASQKQWLITLQSNNNSLQEIVISASRTAQKRSEAPVAIATISKQTMEDTKATRIDQLVNKISGVNMVSLGNEQHSMSIRQPMTTKSLFLYLEDGIPIRTTGVYNHNALLEMNMPAARQIEVIKGPSSSLYGAEAIGGAINIITQAPPAVFSGQVSVQVNNNGYKRTDVQVGNTFGKFGLLISGYYANRHNGPVDHSDFHKTGITLRGDYAISERTKWVNDLTYVNYYSDMLGSLDSAHFAGKDYSTPQTFTYRKVPALRYKSQLLHQWNSNSSTQVSFIFRDNSVQQNPSYRVKNIANDPARAYGEINESAFNTYMLIAQHQQSFDFLNSKLIAGISVDNSPSTYNSNFININRDGRGYYVSYATTDSVLSQYKTGINNLASYLHYEAAIAKGLKLTAALRYDLYHYDFENALPPSAFTGAPSTKNDFNRFSPKVGATWNYKGTGIYANYSEGFVPPQISELYTGVKVPYLGPQTFYNYEVGGWFSLLKNKLYADWSWYLLNGTNEIISVRNADGSTENQNAGKTKHTGIEYGITYRPISALSIRFSAANSKHSFVDYVEKGTAYNNNELAGGPRFIANAEVTYKPVFVKGLRLSAEWQHTGPYFMDNANSKKYGGYDLLNVRAGYSIKKFDVWVNALNSTNTYYSTFASKAGSTLSYNLGDPRELTVGIAYKFIKR